MHVWLKKTHFRPDMLERKIYEQRRNDVSCWVGLQGSTQYNVLFVSRRQIGCPLTDKHTQICGVLWYGRILFQDHLHNHEHVIWKTEPSPWSINYHRYGKYKVQRVGHKDLSLCPWLVPTFCRIISPLGLAWQTIWSNMWISGFITIYRRVLCSLESSQ